MKKFKLGILVAGVALVVQGLSGLAQAKLSDKVFSTGMKNKPVSDLGYYSCRKQMKQHGVSNDQYGQDQAGQDCVEVENMQLGRTRLVSCVTQLTSESISVFGPDAAFQCTLLIVSGKDETAHVGCVKKLRSESVGVGPMTASTDCYKEAMANDLQGFEDRVTKEMNDGATGVDAAYRACTAKNCRDALPYSIN